MMVTETDTSGGGLLGYCIHKAFILTQVRLIQIIIFRWKLKYLKYIYGLLVKWGPDLQSRILLGVDLSNTWTDAIVRILTHKDRERMSMKLQIHTSFNLSWYIVLSKGETCCSHTMKKFCKCNSTSTAHLAVITCFAKIKVRRCSIQFLGSIMSFCRSRSTGTFMQTYSKCMIK